MCSTAVTFGGGITIVNGARSPPARAERDALRGEEIGLHPARVNLPLDRGEVVLRGERFCHAKKLTR